MSQSPDLLVDSDLHSLPLVYRGKVRDLYDIDDRHLLMIATDRLSAFDVILPTGIPGKGETLTAVSNFWFARTGDMVVNHLELAEIGLEQAVPDPDERNRIASRAVVARKLRTLPVEAIVRGYIIGSGWKDYQSSGAISGVKLPAGLRQADKLPEPIYTPSTKAAVGDHDVNVDFDYTVAQIGRELAEQVRDVSLKLYKMAADYALGRGIIIADTKFEFGLDRNDRLVLMDEILTPDSSRFWPADQYRPGSSPPSFDKQFVRDYLETLEWDKTAPGPELPTEIVEKTAAKYQEARQRLTG